MREENRAPLEESRKHESNSRKRYTARLVGVLLATFLAFVVGLIGGSSFGGDHAPGFSLFGMPGYEGSGLLAGLVAGLAVLLIGGVALALPTRRGALLLTVVGALAAIAIGPRLLFPVLPLDELTFALTYIGCAAVGAVIGWGISLLGAKTAQSP